MELRRSPTLAASALQAASPEPATPPDPFRVGPHLGGLPAIRLRRVLDYIEAYLGEEIDVEALAAHAGLSPHHFATLFKASTGMPPHRYLLQRRVAQAQSLLAGTQRPLADIAVELGFSSQAHFTTVFRRLVGTTPGAWRLSDDFTNETLAPVEPERPATPPPAAMSANNDARKTTSA